MITLTAMIRQLQDEKEALDATIAALQHLKRKQNSADSKPNSAVKASGKSITPRGFD